MSLSRVARTGLVALALMAATLVVSPAPPAAAIAPPVQAPPPSFTPLRHRAPVVAPVVDPFRAPSSRFGPGNRGLEYATTAGTAVRSSAPGVVVFAGSVGGVLHVVVAHADGLRTTYGQLASIAVRVGQAATAATVVGRSGPRLHFGVRLGDVYLDPARLLGEGLDVRVRLVPWVLRPGMVDVLERQWRAEMGAGVTFGAVLDAAGRTLGRGLDPDVVRERLEALAQIYVSQFRIWTAIELRDLMFDWWEQRDDCTPVGAAVPVGANRHHLVVLVAGFGSASTPGSGIEGLDLEALGYDPARVARFSYGGGVVPGSGRGPFSDMAEVPYSVGDSQIALDEAAARLRALLAELALAHPGVPIDVVGHSQGGVVAVRAVQDLGPGLPLPPDTSVVTIGAPHAGSSLARTLGLAGTSRFYGPLLEGATVVAPNPLGALDLDSPAAQDLRSTSPFMEDYGRRPLSPGVDVTSIAGRVDPVVPSPDSSYQGRPTVVVGNGTDVTRAHGDLPAHPLVQREVGLALQGLDPTCHSLGESLFDHAVGTRLTDVWDALGVYSQRWA